MSHNELQTESGQKQQKKNDILGGVKYLIGAHNVVQKTVKSNRTIPVWVRALHPSHRRHPRAVRQFHDASDWSTPCLTACAPLWPLKRMEKKKERNREERMQQKERVRGQEGEQKKREKEHKKWEKGQKKREGWVESCDSNAVSHSSCTALTTEQDEKEREKRWWEVNERGWTSRRRRRRGNRRMSRWQCCFWQQLALFFDRYEENTRARARERTRKNSGQESGKKTDRERRNRCCDGNDDVCAYERGSDDIKDDAFVNPLMHKNATRKRRQQQW